MAFILFCKEICYVKSRIQGEDCDMSIPLSITFYWLGCSKDESKHILDLPFTDTHIINSMRTTFAYFRGPKRLPKGLCERMHEYWSDTIEGKNQQTAYA